MKKASKTLAVLLSVLLLFSFGTTVFADETTVPVSDPTPEVTSSPEPSTEPEPSETPEASPSESPAPETPEEESSAPETSTPEEDGTESSAETPSAESSTSPAALTAAKLAPTAEGSLQEQIDDGAEEITVSGEVTESLEIPEGRTVTIVLEDGATLTNNEGEHTIENHGTLTVTGSGTVKNTSSQCGALANYPGATANLNGGTFTGDKWYVIKNLGSMTIAGASVIQNDSGSSNIANGFYGNPGNDLDETPSKNSVVTLTINAGQFSGGMNTVKNDDYGVLTINDGTFSNTSGPTVLNWNKTTITGGTFSVNDGASSVLANGYIAGGADEGQMTITGGTFTAANDGTGNLFSYGQGSTKGGFVKISDGTFKGVIETDSSYPYTPAITGGSYTTDVSDYVEDGYTTTDSDGLFTITDATEPTKDSVAETGGIYYKSVQNAINAAEGGATVTLVENTTENLTVSEGQNVVLDLNGNTLSGNANAPTVTVNGGKLSVEDSTAASAPSVDGNYKVSYASGSITGTQNAVVIFNNGSFTLESGTLVSTEDCGVYAGAKNGGIGTAVINGGYIHAREYGVGVMMEGSSVTVNGGVIEADDNAAVAGNGTAGVGGTTININGGTLISHIKSNGYIACGIYHPQSGTLNVSGGTIYADGGVGILMRAGSANITGGEIIATGSGTGKVGDSTVLNGHYGILFDTSSNYPGMTAEDVVKISGTASVQSEEPSLSVTGTGTNHRIEVSGGTFSSDVTNFVVKGAEVYKDENGNFGIRPAQGSAVAINGVGYTTMQDAVDAIATSESKTGTITVLKDIPDATGVKVPEGLNLTIDFAGHTYKLSGPGAGSTNTETNGFQLLKDSNIVFKNGTINIAKNANNIKRMVQNYANLTLEDMRFEAANQVGGENYALSFNNGNIVFKGNTSIITTSDDTIAFDVCKFSNYEGVNVTFSDSYTGEINGRIVYDSPDSSNWSLTVNGNGKFGGIDLSDAATDEPNISVTGGTFESDPMAYVADSSSAVRYTSNGQSHFAVGAASIRDTAAQAADDSAIDVLQGDVSVDITADNVTVSNSGKGTVSVNKTPVESGSSMEVHRLEKVEAKAATCKEEGHKAYYKCAECGELFEDANGTIPTTAAAVTIPKTEHSFGEWEVTKPATTTEKGEKQRTCSICGLVETAEIPLLDKPDPDPSTEPSAAPSTEPTAAPSAAPTEKPATSGPQTGDEGVSAVWIALLAISGCAVTLLSVKRRKS